MLPHADRAKVPGGKLTAYLLNRSHPKGGTKAAFFRGHGFDESNTVTLAAGLRAIAQSGTLVNERLTPFGTTYAIVGDLPTPRGTTIFVRTVWAIDADQTDPRFVSAYPETRPRTRYAPS